MKLIIYVLAFLFISINILNAQPVIWTEGFETTQPPNLPTGWSYTDISGLNVLPDTNWSVRDSGTVIPGINTARTAIPHSGFRLCGVSWLVGNGAPGDLTDSWLVSKKIVNVPGDGLLQFYASGGNPTLSDSLQIWISTTDSLPASFLANPANYNQSIAFAPNPIYPTYLDYYVDLSSYAGQNVYIGFRYYVNVSVDGVYVQIDDVTFSGTVGINQINSSIPGNFELKQNYPNPFNPVTKINFDLAKSTNVRLTVFNSLGQKVREIFNGFKSAGSYEAEFDGSNLSSGTYYYRLETDNFTDTKKMFLVK